MMHPTDEQIAEIKLRWESRAWPEIGYFVHGQAWDDIQTLLAIADDRNRLEAEVERLSKLVYAPGQWRCPKCEFQLTQRNLYAQSGTVGPRDDPGDKCPNCNSSLWRVTERDAGNEMVDLCEKAVLRAHRLDAVNRELAEALREIVKADEGALDELRRMGIQVHRQTSALTDKARTALRNAEQGGGE